MTLPIPPTPLDQALNPAQGGIAPAAHNGWNHLMQTVATRLPTAFRQARAMRRAALRSIR